MAGLVLDTPAKHIYTGDGTTRVYPIPTYIQGDDWIRIEIDGVYIVDRRSYDIVNNSIIFVTAPGLNTQVSVQVATSVEALSQLGNSTNVDIVAGNISKVNTVATNIVDINQIADNLPEILLAVDSATTATQQATTATQQATIATTKASEAITSANTAKEWASKEYGLEIETGLYSARHYAIEASNITKVTSINGMIGDVVLSKSNVLLGNVDNTSDTNKPISTATQTALNSKVDKVSGKQLSTEDYTTADKNKLAGLSNYIKPASEPISYISSLQTVLAAKSNITGAESLHQTDALRLSGTTLSLHKGNGTSESVVLQDTIYTLPNASATVLGGIKVGTNLSIDADGVLSANDTNVSFSEISGKPTNLSGYGITDAQPQLVSGTNIKTINGESVLGSGDLVITGGGAVDLSEYYKKTETYSKVEVDIMVGNIALALDTINGEVV